MARPNFSVDIGGYVTFSRPNGSGVQTFWQYNARHAEETVSGTNRRKPVGWIPPTGYSMTHKNIDLATGSCLNVTIPSNLSSGQKYVGVVGGLNGRFSSETHFNTTMSEADAIDSSILNRALLKARLDLKQTNINLGVAFAERNATARLLGDTATRIGKSFRHLRRGRIRQAMNDLGITSKKGEPRGGNVPQKWLELQYGWKPLLSDVYGACTELSELSRDDWRVTTKGKIHSKHERTVMFSGTDFGSCTARSENYALVRIDALPANEGTISLASSGITNPLLIAWELVPFSFVVDWALPVGSWLENLDALLGYGLAYTSSTLFTRTEWEEKGGYKANAYANGGFIDNKYSGRKRVVRLVRTAQQGVPLATFPRVKDPFSLGHMANGLSLLAAAFGRPSGSPRLRSDGRVY